LHDNAQPHTSAHTRETLPELKSEVLDYTAYSPDLAPLNFHLFEPLMGALGRHQFADDDDVTKAVHDWLHTAQAVFSDGIRNLVGCQTKSVKMLEGYVEK
jgi:hypothetical protein